MSSPPSLLPPWCGQAMLGTPFDNCNWVQPSSPFACTLLHQVPDIEWSRIKPSRVAHSLGGAHQMRLGGVTLAWKHCLVNSFLYSWITAVLSHWVCYIAIAKQGCHNRTSGPSLLIVFSWIFSHILAAAFLLSNNLSFPSLHSTVTSPQSTSLMSRTSDLALHTQHLTLKQLFMFHIYLSNLSLV